MNDFIKAITEEPTAAPILVYFTGRPEPVEYTAAIMELLKSDPATETITDAETGEILFYRQ